MKWFACLYGCHLCRSIMIWFWLRVTTDYVCERTYEVELYSWLGSDELCVCEGSTKFCTWVQRICVCEWIYEVKHLDPGSTKLRTWVQRICVCEWVYEVKHLDPDLRSLALGSNLIVWFRFVGDMCNVCGSVAFSYVLMRLDGQLNITNIGMIPKRIFFIWFEPELSKRLSQAITDGCQIKGPAVGHL